MESFNVEQKILKLGSVTVGGQPGEKTTCMIGSMFYKGHSILKDKKRGIFDKNKAEQEIKEIEKVSKETGLQFIIDVIGNTPDNLIKYCKFVADTLEDKERPFLLDGLTDAIRVPAMQKLVEIGLGNRIIYNSIEPKIKEETINAINECKIKNAMVLLFDSRLLLPKQKLKLLNGFGEKEGLINIAKRCGVENFMIDTAVLDMPSIGIAADIIMKIKAELGIPAGCAPSNAVFESRFLSERGKEDRNACLISACSYLAANGADFILFGPVKHAPKLFLPVAQVNGFIAYKKRRVDKIKFSVSEHPLSKVF
ncbi:MAG: hypothetical protein ACTSVI_15690 [Promethearchaeota archaeon]